MTAMANMSDGSSSIVTDTVSWSSDNEAVLSINGQGLALAVKPGTAKITATKGSYTGSVVLTVTDAVLQSLSISPAELSLPMGLTQTLSLTGTYSDGSSKQVTTGVTWTVTDASISTVDAGVVTAKTKGGTSITASVGAVNANMTIAVTDAVLQSIAVTTLSGTQSSASVAAGLSQQLKAVGLYSDGSNQDLSSKVRWTSSANIAAVTTSGLATTTTQGSSTITATDANTSISGTFSLTVTQAVLTALAISPSEPAVAAGLNQLMTLTGTYTDGSTSSSLSNVVWTSSATGTATVATNGLASGVAKGSTTLTAQVGTLTKTVTFTVTDPIVTKLTISSVLDTVTNGASVVLSALAEFSNGVTQTVTDLVTWVVESVTGQATVAVANGGASLTGTGVGDVNVTASYLGVSSNVLRITVTPLKSIKGIAASGTALGGATVRAVCQTTGGSTTTVEVTAAADGSYVITLADGVTAPCLMSATSTDQIGVTTTLYSYIAADVGTTDPVANITPITQLLVTNALGSVPSSSTTTVLTASDLAGALNVVQAGLSSILGIDSTALADPIATTFTASMLDAGVNADSKDAAIDTVMSMLNVSNTPLSALANVLATASSSSVASALDAFVATNNVPTSAAATCPYAVSGVYAMANVGSTNVKTDGNPNFGVMKLDFAANTAVNGLGRVFAISPTTVACQFSLDAPATQTLEAKKISLQVSRAGFIVATSAPPPASDQDPWLAIAGTDSRCFTPGSGCSGYQLGFPVQTGVDLTTMAGSQTSTAWQSVEWSPTKFTTASDNTQTAITYLPCQGAQSLESNNSVSCSEYLSFFRRFEIAAPTGVTSTSSGASSLNVYDCDGLYQGGSGSCLSTPENQGAIVMQMCKDRSDCPTASYFDTSGALQSVTLTSVIDVVGGSNLDVVVGHALMYKTPGNDLVGFFVANAGGPDVRRLYPNSANMANAFSGYGYNAFQEQFGVFYRAAHAATLPAVGTVVNNPQWQLVAYNASISRADVAGTTMSNVVMKQGSNALAVGQELSLKNKSSGVGIQKGTTIAAINTVNGIYTLACKDANGNPKTDCRTGTFGSSTTFGGGSCVATPCTNTAIFATSEQVKEDTQIYTVVGQGSVTNSIRRTFSNKTNNGMTDQVVMDVPYPGMTWRAYVAASASVTGANESISLRGSGWSVASGTATLAQQIGGLTVNGNFYTTFCTMPGEIFDPANGGSCTGTKTTGKYFTVNLKY